MRILVPLLLLLVSACDPKPLADAPSLSPDKKTDHADRELPGGKTLVVALALLDPRAGDPDQLAQRRAEFERKLGSLVPRAEDRASLGFDAAVQWHKLYERRLAEHQRGVAALDDSVRALLQPKKGETLRVDDEGQASMCDAGGTCRKVPGYPQVGHEVRALNTALSGVLEAQWHLLDRLAALRARLGQPHDA